MAELVQHVNDSKDVLADMLVKDGIITEKQQAQIRKYAVVLATKKSLGEAGKVCPNVKDPEKYGLLIVRVAPLDRDEDEQDERDRDQAIIQAESTLNTL
jgi:hypothetical protein